jgi:hypothetical protein
MTSGHLRKLAAGGAIMAIAAGVAVSATASTSSHPRSATTDFRTYPSCPLTDRHQLTSRTTGSHRKLVPAGARQVLLCRYGGLNAGAERMRLVKSRMVLAAPTVVQLAREFNMLHAFPSGPLSCPADFGAKVIAIFRYLPTQKSDDPVTVDTSGCTPVTNGHLVRWAALAPGPAMLQQLKMLTR